jgi:anti-sigma factor (TIGR02949 family)
MNRIQFGQGGCEKALRYLDAYISNELTVETNHEVLRHLEGCQACSAELDARTRLRSRLNTAVKAQSVPPELQARIREQIRNGRPGSWLSLESLKTGGWRWAGAMAAACLVVAAGLWVNYSAERMPTLADRPAQNAYITRVSANLAAVLKVGLGDHIHCSIFRKYPKDAPPVEKMEGELGATYSGLLPVVRAAVPDSYRVIMAHQCSYAGRKFIHLTFEKDGGLLSLVIARKEPGESLQGLAPTTQSSGIPIYQSAAGRYEVAGFQAGNYFAYVVSELKGKANLQIAANMAVGVHEFLAKTAA